MNLSDLAQPIRRAGTALPRHRIERHPMEAQRENRAAIVLALYRKRVLTRDAAHDQLCSFAGLANSVAAQRLDEVDGETA